MEPCQPPLFFGDRQGIDLSGWNGSINAPAFRALVDATGAVSRGERPKAGVGYSTGKTRSSFSYLATIFSLFAIVSATGSIANLISLGSATEVVRDIVQSYRALTYPILEYGLGWTGIELSRFARDILLFWLVLGASIARALYRDVSLSGWSSGARQGSIGAYVISISALVLWPIYLAGIILTPIRATVVRQTAGGVEQSQLLRLDATGLRLIERFAPQVRIKSRQNLLVVLLAQVSVVFIAVLLFLISGVV